MFVFSVCASKKRVWSLILCGGMLIAVVAVAVNAPWNGAAADQNGGTAVARARFLGSLGYEVTETAGGSERFRLPDEWDERLCDYNARQQEAGYDLMPYKGREIERFCYAVHNYPGAAEVSAHLYVCEGRVIGGDITAAGSPGFVRGLGPCPKAETTET